MNALKLFFLGFFLINFNVVNAQTLESLQGNLPLPSLLLPDDKVSDWERNRLRIKNRILNSWGNGSTTLDSMKNKFHIHRTFELNGHKVIEYKYQVYNNEFDQGYLILPKNFNKEHKYKCFIAIHGSNKALGGYQSLDIVNAPNRAYAFEMASRGYVAFAPSHFDFGDTLLTTPQKTLRKKFIKEHPNWSIIGRQMSGFVRALDMLDQLPFVKRGAYSVMGHSLGGRSALFLAALDQRVKSAVISAGVSVKHSNIYRGLSRDRNGQPIFWNSVTKNGRPPWELNEMIALAAPTPLLFVEPYNDPYNPYVGHATQAFNSSQEIWRLYDAEAEFNVYLHGDGHDTKANVRKLSYDWLIAKDEKMSE